MPGEFLFFSDCHLDPSRPEVGAALVDFLDRRAAGAERIYILGDLFEVWIGDDSPLDGLEPVIDALARRASDSPVFFLAGNRDFLVGREFAARVGLTLLEEPERLDLGDARAVLMHGDTLCTDDRDYQAFRAQVRDPAWQADFLARPLAERQRIAAGLRADSVAAMAKKSMEIMDVNADAVSRCFASLGVDAIVHGHTHRPAMHAHAPGLTRCVLGDWNPGPSYLSWRPATGFELVDPRT